MAFRNSGSSATGGMLLSVLLAGLFGGFAPSACEAQEPTWNPQPLRETFIDIYQLKDWGRQRYARYWFPNYKTAKKGVVVSEREAKLQGIYPYETKVEFDTVVFNDVWRDPVNTERSLVVRYECERNSLMGLRKMSTKFHEWHHCDFTEGKYHAELFGGEPRTGVWPKETLTDVALMRLVTILPRTPGAEYTFEHFSITPDIDPQPAAASIRCWGTQSVTLRGENYSCTHYQAGDYHLWVRDDGILMRMEVPGWQILEWVDPQGTGIDYRQASVSPLAPEGTEPPTRSLFFAPPVRD